MREQLTGRHSGFLMCVKWLPWCYDFHCVQLRFTTSFMKQIVGACASGWKKCVTSNCKDPLWFVSKCVWKHWVQRGVNFSCFVNVMTASIGLLKMNTSVQCLIAVWFMCINVKHQLAAVVSTLCWFRLELHWTEATMLRTIDNKWAQLWFLH